MRYKLICNIFVGEKKSISLCKTQENWCCLGMAFQTHKFCACREDLAAVLCAHSVRCPSAGQKHLAIGPEGCAEKMMARWTAPPWLGLTGHSGSCIIHLGVLLVPVALSRTDCCVRCPVLLCLCSLLSWRVHFFMVYFPGFHVYLKKIKIKALEFRSEDFGLFRNFFRRALKRPRWAGVF